MWQQDGVQADVIDFGISPEDGCGILVGMTGWIMEV